MKLKQSFRLLLTVYIFVNAPIIFAKEVGLSQFSENGYIEYILGNLPIALSPPHGGDLEPNSIPNRLCAGGVTGNDYNTLKLTREIVTSFAEKTGCYPHAVINRLARKKLDANREIIKASRNDDAETAWGNYHRFMGIAKNQIQQDYGRGVFLGVHGQGHDIRHVQVGYLLM